MWDASSELKEYLPHSFFREAYARQNEEISQNIARGRGVISNPKKLCRFCVLWTEILGMNFRENLGQHFLKRAGLLKASWIFSGNSSILAGMGFPHNSTHICWKRQLRLSNSFLRYLMGLSCQDNWSNNRESNWIKRKRRDESGILSSVLASVVMRVKKVFRKFCKVCQNLLEKIGFRMMNLTKEEETILKRMMLEQETMRQSSVSFIITMDNAEVEEREKLMKKIQKDQEILERLDEVGHTFCKLIFCIYLWTWYNFIKCLVKNISP